MMKTIERRSVALKREPVEAGSDDEWLIRGHGSVYGIEDAYGDVIAEGAFAESIEDAMSSGVYPAMLLQHGGMQIDAMSMTPIGIWTALAEDDRGLAVEGALARTRTGDDIKILLNMKPRPALNGLSIGFVPKTFDRGTKPGEPRRTLRSVRLMEISLVTFPANDQARVTKSSIDGIKTQGELERFILELPQLDMASATELIRKINDLGGYTQRSESDIAAAINHNINMLKVR